MSRYIDHYKGERKQDYQTPKPFFDELNRKYRFTLDGAATAENALLPRFSTEDEPVAWKGERVFCNPPWSNIRPFVEQMPDAEFACLLVPARTNCKWFHRALDLGAKPEYFKPKLKFFGKGKDNSPVDCVLLILGVAVAEVARRRGREMQFRSKTDSLHPGGLATAGSTPACHIQYEQTDCRVGPHTGQGRRDEA